MILGFSSIAAAFVIFVYATNNRTDMKKFKHDHPGLSVFIVLLGAWAFMYIMGSVLTFLFGIALPMLGKEMFKFELIMNLQDDC